MEHFFKPISSFYKTHPKKQIITLILINTTFSIAKLTISIKILTIK